MGAGPDISAADYYADPAVRDRISEYCGATADAPASCLYLASIATLGEAFRGWEAAPRYPPEALDALLAAGGDIARSILDARNFVVHFDLDYLNVDCPGEAFLHQADTFLKLEPIYRAARDMLAAFDLPLLTLMTGRGYHFTGRVPLDDPAIDRLAALAQETPAWFATAPGRQPPWLPAPLTEREARAYAGASLVYEYLGHKLVRQAAATSPIPITFNGTIVGTGLVGRECVSIDLSAAGDPIDVRHIRVAFGLYQRHRLRPDVFGLRVATEVPPVVALPRHEDSTWDLLRHGRGTSTALELARTERAELPIATSGLARVIDAYTASRLANFHRDFYSRPPIAPSESADALAAVDLARLPACVAAPLAQPNDLLLQPTYLQHLTRYFLAEGWHPRSIAGLVHAHYASDCNWGDRWSRLDARTRAEFDVRVFAGLLAAGVDQGIDFNCRSAQEKALCPRRHCAFDLRVNRDRLRTAEVT